MRQVPRKYYGPVALSAQNATGPEIIPRTSIISRPNCTKSRRNQTALSLVVTGVVLLVFGVFYTVIYRVTSNAYYAIVSGAKETQ